MGRPARRPTRIAYPIDSRKLAAGGSKTARASLKGAMPDARLTWGQASNPNIGAMTLGWPAMKRLGGNVEASQPNRTRAILTALYNTMEAVPHSF